MPRNGNNLFPSVGNELQDKILDYEDDSSESSIYESNPSEIDISESDRSESEYSQNNHSEMPDFNSHLDAAHTNLSALFEQLTQVYQGGIIEACNCGGISCPHVDAVFDQIAKLVESRDVRKIDELRSSVSKLEQKELMAAGRRTVEFARFQSELSERDNKLNDLERTIEYLQKQNADMENEVGRKYERNVAEKDKKLNELKRTVNSKQARINYLEDRNAELDSEVRNSRMNGKPLHPAF